MRRTSPVLSLVIVAAPVLLTGASGARGQQATPVASASLAGHSLVGAWVFDGTPEDAIRTSARP